MRGASTVVEFGAIGKSATVQEKHHKDAAAAEAFCAKMIAEKRKKFYV